MTNRNYNTERIEDTLWDLCRNIAFLSKNVFTGKRPDATALPMEEFVVISLLTTMKDHEALGRGVIRISIYVKDLQGGIKNSKVLREMGETLLAYLPYETKDYFFDFSSESTFPDKSGYTVKAINAYVTTLTRN